MRQDAAESLHALADWLTEAGSVCVVTGAGVSAESGVPTFRDAQTGLWARYDPMQLATPEAFAANPERVWSWYQYRRRLVRGVEPNPGHVALVRLEARVGRFSLITQNVDGLHARAGSRDIVEFHGNLFDNRCSAGGHIVTVADSDQVPRCPDCGALVRPGVVWFGESIPGDALGAANAAAADCDVFLSVGTSSSVYPAAGLADLARASGAKIAEINPAPTGRAADLVIALPSGEALPALVKRLGDPTSLYHRV